MKIDPEFRALIPPLQPEELRQLEENLVAHGCRDPLVLWHGILIDGHNRYDICTRRRIRYKTVDMALQNRERVLLWIEENQLGRRNLPDDQRSAIALSVHERKVALAKKERAAAAGKAGGVGRPKNSLGDNATSKLKEPAKRSRPAVAKAARVPERKLRAVAELKKKSVEAYQRVRSGESTIKKEKAALKQAEKQKVVEKIKAEAPQYPTGPFRVIVIDPPWKYAVRSEDASHRAANPYPDMDLEEIKAVPVASWAHDDCVLWLWTTNAFLREAFACLDAWGFTQKSMLTWVKDRMGTGDWLRGRTEHCLMAVKGKPTICLTNQTTALMAPLREHSRKPEEFYALVEALCPGNKYEHFGRTQREGWTVMGAEAERFRNTG